MLNTQRPTCTYQCLPPPYFCPPPLPTSPLRQRTVPSGFALLSPAVARYPGPTLPQKSRRIFLARPTYDHIQQIPPRPLPFDRWPLFPFAPLFLPPERVLPEPGLFRGLVFALFPFLPSLPPARVPPSCDLPSFSSICFLCPC